MDAGRRAPEEALRPGSRRRRAARKSGAQRRAPNGNGNDRPAHARPSPPQEEDLETFRTTWEAPVAAMQVEDYYFNSYAHLSIHEDMLRDDVRTEAYLRAIEGAADLFRGKIVLDIGCGTGVLSIFAARAGAAHVYGVECSEIVGLARRVAEANGYSNQITFLQGKVEEVALPVERVDIIISEWMGYFLLYESMLDTVLFARDKWLVPGGALLPDRARICIAGVEDPDYLTDKIGYWNRVYGFDLSPVGEAAVHEPVVETLPDFRVVTDPARILDLDLTSCPRDAADFVGRFALRVQKQAFVSAVGAWFEVEFSAGHAQPVVLTTEPWCTPTHWHQTMFYMDRQLVVYPDEEVIGAVSCRKNATNPRDLDIAIAVAVPEGRYPVGLRTHRYNLR